VVIRYTINILLGLSLLLFLSVTPSWAIGEKVSDDLEISMDFKNVELLDMIETMSELTGKNFVYDKSVHGQISIISPHPVSVAEAYRLFITALGVKGYTIVPAGKVYKIIAIKNARETNLPVDDDKDLGEQFVTRIIKLKNLDAVVIADTILRPLMAKTSHVVAHGASNRVVITDSAANIRRLLQIIASLENAWNGEQMVIVPLQFSDADEIASLVMRVLEGGGTVPVLRARKQVSVHKKACGHVLPYKRTNKLLLLGDKQFISQTRKLISQLDEKAGPGHSGIHVYYLEHAEAVGLAETLNKIVTGAKTVKGIKTGKASHSVNATTGMFGTVTITADKPTNALIVSATAKDYSNIESLIQQLDIKRKQVFVEALILELSMDALMDLGTSLQGAVSTGSDSVILGGTNSGVGGMSALAPVDGVPGLLSQAVNGIMLGGLFNPISTIINGEEVTVPALSALIGLSQTDADVNVLSAPRLLTSDNEEAEIIVGKNVPIITSKSTDNAGNPVNSVERQDVALTLRFTPQVTEGDLVRLKIYQEISDITKSVGTVDEVGPTFKKTLLRNTIVARDGETVVLGGLFQTDITQSVTKVPLLGDIPLLGLLFKRTKEVENKTSLLIFITPHVVRNSEDLERITSGSRKKLDLFKSDSGSDKFFGLKKRDLEGQQPAAAVEEEADVSF